MKTKTGICGVFAPKQQMEALPIKNPNFKLRAVLRTRQIIPSIEGQAEPSSDVVGQRQAPNRAHYGQKPKPTFYDRRSV